MESASLLSQMADSWVLLAMFTLFIGAILWALRPGSRDVHRDTAGIPFRNEDHPGSSEVEEPQS